MKITIVIPVYNVEPYIEDCLKSVAAQTYKGDIECIIVNDCTPDNSCVIIERFKKEYNGNIDFKLLHHTVNRGLSAARNTGIDAATGEYIYFLDSDDEIMPECIEVLAEPLKNKKYDFVIGDYITTFSQNIAPLLQEDGELLGSEEIRKSYFANKWYSMAVNKLCNINFIREHHLNFKEGLINEDELWSFQLANIAKSMFVTKRNTYLYKTRDSSIMGSIGEYRKAISYSTIVTELQRTIKERDFVYDNLTFKKILSVREHTLCIIFSRKTYRERKDLYLKCHKALHINAWETYKNRLITKKSITKELFNHLPGMLGFWYLSIYRRIHK